MTAISRFDPQSLLKPQLASILSSKLKAARWDKTDKEKNRALSRTIADAAKAKMIGTSTSPRPSRAQHTQTDLVFSLVGDRD